MRPSFRQLSADKCSARPLSLEVTISTGSSPKALGIGIAGIAIATSGVTVALTMIRQALHNHGAILKRSTETTGMPSVPLVEDDRPEVGTNVDALSSWSTATPFLDLMKSSSDWLPQASPGIWDTQEKLDLDDAGWVRSLPTSGPARHRTAGLVVLRGADAGAAPPRARYVVLYDGEGVIEGMQGTTSVSKDPARRRLLVQAADNGWLHIEIRSTDPKRSGNYLRNIRIVREEYLPAFERGEVFHPSFLEKILPFQAIRFMDWMATNKLIRSDGTELVRRGREPYDVSKPTLLSWEHRPQLGDAFWTRGVPVEVMVALANRTGAAPWFNMPINASDDYVRGFATYVKSHLKPTIPVHVELSNEVWNLGFVQARYAEARAKELFGDGAVYLEWYGKRAAEIGTIWNRAFDEPVTGSTEPGRVSIVYGTQVVWKGRETPGLETPHWRGRNGNHLRAAHYFNEYAIAGYYGLNIPQSEKLSTVTSWWSDADGGYGKGVTSLHGGVTSDLTPLYNYHAARARDYGLALVTYEAGFGELTPPNQHLNVRYTDFLINLQRRPEIYRVEIANYSAFRHAGGKLFMNYGLVGKPSKYGSWSVLESINQRTSPRYEALRDMLRISSTAH